MEANNELMFIALLTGLRRTGILDKRSAETVAQILAGFRSKLYAPESAARCEISGTVVMVREGPLMSCCSHIPDGLTNKVRSEIAAHLPGLY